MRNRAGVLRVAALALAAGGLVAGATWSTGSVQLATPHERAGLPQGSDVLVEEATLLCPGQSQQGAEGLRNVPGSVRAAVAAPPRDVLAAVKAAGPGTLSLRTAPGGTSLLSAADRGRVATAVVPESATSDAVVATSTGVLAPGLVAAQTWLRAGDDDRGLSLTPCLRAGSDLWLLGGSAGPSRTERLVLVNPGANAVSVRLEVLGSKGPIDGLEDRSLSIAPGGRTVVSVDALAPDEPSPVVHVVASGGVVGGVLVDSWIDGATGRGTDTVTAAAAPSTEVVVAGVDVAGAAVLRVANPGSTEALVQVRLLTPDGGTQPDALRTLRVPPRSSVDVSLFDQVKGMNALRLVSDQPVVAGVFVERRATTGADRMGDFAWAPATPSITRLGGLALPSPGEVSPVATLALATGEGGATATVSTVKDGVVSSRPVSLAAETIASIPLGDAQAVWVEPTAGEVFGAVTLLGSDEQGPLYSVAGVYSAPVTALSTPVRHVGR